MVRWLLSALALVGAGRAFELLGYVENWNDATWWDTSVPGACLQGCFRPETYFNRTAPYTSLNYGFVFLTNNPNASQISCRDNPNQSTWVNCPVWEGHTIYISEESKEGSGVIDNLTDVSSQSSGLIAIAETVRLGRMHPAGPKRTKISIGGWSDFARLGTDENAVKAAKLIGKLVRITLADGVDVDMEHLTPFAADFPLRDEFGAVATFIVALRKELDDLQDTWVQSVIARRDALQEQSDEYTDMDAPPFFETSLAYLNEVAANGVPHLEISWSTRFNSFVPAGSPFNYLKKGSKAPNETFATDNEGKKLWPRIGSSVDTVNIMAYDASGLAFDYGQILQNFVDGGVPKHKIVMGFEPGEQAANGVWEGMQVDMATTRLIKQGGYGGCMVWAANPSRVQAPRGQRLTPEVAEGMAAILEPEFRWGPAPVYTKADPVSGWLKGMRSRRNASHEHAAKDARAHLPTRPSLQRPRGKRVAVASLAPLTWSEAMGL